MPPFASRVGLMLLLAGSLLSAADLYAQHDQEQEQAPLVVTADFNRDGNEDFVITGVIYGVYCFAPVLGNGKGTFGGPTLG